MMYKQNNVNQIIPIKTSVNSQEVKEDNISSNNVIKNNILQTAPVKTSVKQQEVKEADILKEISQSVFTETELKQTAPVKTNVNSQEVKEADILNEEQINEEQINEEQINNYYKNKAQQIEQQNINFFNSRKQMQKVENGKTGKVNYEITRNAVTTKDNIVLQSQLQTDIKVKSASQQFELYKEFVFKQYEKKNVIMNQNLEDLVSNLLSAVEKSFKQFKKSGPEKKALVVDAIINYMLDGDQSVTAAYKAIIQTLVELIYEKYNCVFDEIFQNVFSSEFVEDAAAAASGCLKRCLK